MVTVKRKINSENERYGGFSEIEVKTPNEIGDSFMQAQVKQAEASVNYSPAPNLKRPNKDPRKVSDISPDRIEERTPAANEYMMKIHSEKQQDKKSVAVEKKHSMDGRTKLLLGVYLTIIVLLSALVIVSGVLLSSTGARVEELNNELAAKNAYLNEQLTEIAMLKDENFLTDKAYNNGMENIENSEEIDLLPMGEAQTYEGTTNWFDSFCDWMSGVFGG